MAKNASAPLPSNPVPSPREQPGLSNDPVAAEPGTQSAARPVDPRKKSEPTRSRKEAEAARKQPLVGAGRPATKAARQAQRSERNKQFRLMQAGDERFLPAKDRGPERRFVRNWVDARWNVGEIFLLIAFPVMVAVLFLNQGQSLALLLALYTLMFFAVFDSWWMWRRVRKEVRIRFGADYPVKNLRWYAIMRSFQIRRLRLPKPQVRHGEFPK